MGAGKVVPADRSKSHVSYYVATVAIVGLLALLCCYVCYYFISKIRELSETDLPSTTPSTSCPKKKEPISYPVQPVVRDGATAMAALCRQLPSGGVPQGDLVFPAGRSPDPRPAHTGPASPGSVPPGPLGLNDVPPAVGTPIKAQVPAPAVAMPCFASEASR